MQPAMHDCAACLSTCVYSYPATQLAAPPTCVLMISS